MPLYFVILLTVSEVSTNRCIRLVELSSDLIRYFRILLLSSKFSKGTITQHPSLTLILLKEYPSEDYRDTVELAEIMDAIRMKIHLVEVPHFKLFRISEGVENTAPSRILSLIK